MKLQSKFDLDQTVYHIRNIGQEMFEVCPSCSAGKIDLPDGR